MAQKEVREIVVRVDTPGENGLKKLADGFGKMNRNISEGTSILKRFEQAYFRIAGLSFAGIGLGAIVQSLDAFQKLNDRLKQTEGSSEGASKALARLQDVASSTKSSVSDTSLIYTRMNQALGDLNLGSEAVLGVTQTLQNAFRAYGATAEEARSATIQLGQGMASGQLRGQELRSVMEASGLLAELFAKKLGIARGELLKWSEKNGGIKNEQILGALADGFDRVNELAGKLTPTVGESLTMALDKVKISAGKFNEELGLTKKLSQGLIFLGENIGTISVVLGTAVGVWGLYKGAILAAAAAHTLHTGALWLMNFAAGANTLTLTLMTVQLYKTAAASSIAQIALGPVGIAVGLISAGYVAWKMGADGAAQSQEKINERSAQGAELVGKNGDAMFRAANAQNKYLEAQNKSTSASDDMTMSQGRWRAEVEKNLSSSDRMKLALDKGVEALKNANAGTFNYAASLTRLNEEFGTKGNVEEYAKRLQALDIAKLTQEFNKGEISLIRFKKEYSDIVNGKSTSSLKQARGELAELNKEFEVEFRTGNVAGYAQALTNLKMDKLNRDLTEGRVSLLEVNKQMRDAALGDFNRQLADGSVNLNTYRSGTQALQLAQINEEWRAGVTDIYADNKAIVDTQDKFAPGAAFFTGTNAYITQAGTLSANVANMVTTTFGNLENTLVEFTKSGKFAFKDMAMAIIEDLNRIIIRSMIIRPLAQGILSGIGGAGAGASMESQNGLGASNPNLAAKGAYFNGKAAYFAKGGVVNGATPFSYGGGKPGVMGESGPESIMPLKRTASGDLGVQATPSNTNISINVMNTSDAQVETKTTTKSDGTKQIDFYIKKKLVESLTDGSLDKTMSQNYNLRRKGV